ncbi:MAG: type II toxin-antitoxin system VapC family toxin [Chloroflexota bacterium]|nr:type II toxin-antitoxin system VapC family toxin [Chloroflexota bacterium]
MTSDHSGPIVVDASVAIAICIEEPGFEWAVRVLRQHGADGERILVPAFFWLEILNVLITRYRQPPGLVLQAIVDLENFELTSVELDRPQVLLTLDVMGRHGLSAYDAAYLALVESAEGALLTFDHRLAAAAGPRAMRPGPGHAIEESREAYAESWAAWPGSAAYLKKLRAQVVRQANG